MSLSKLNIGRPTKTYTHSMSAKAYGTVSFGYVSNLYSLNLQPHDYVDINMRQVLRLAPMPVPTFGSIRSVNVPAFVSMESIFPLYEQFLAGQPVKRTDGSKVTLSTVDYLPWVTNSQLLCYLLRGALCTVATAANAPEFSRDLRTQKYTYKWAFVETERKKLKDFLYKFGNVVKESFGFGTAEDYVPTAVGDRIAALTDVSPQLYGYASMSDLVNSNPIIDEFTHSLLPEAWNAVGFANYVEQHPNVTVDNADVILSDVGSKNLFCFRLAPRQRRLYSLLRSLGYSLDFCDYNRLSILPMLAYYKGYFDMFYPKRAFNWDMTVASSIVAELATNRYDFKQHSIFGWSTVDGFNLTTSFIDFLNLELSDCRSVGNVDYLSAHLSKEDLNKNVQIGGIGYDGTTIVASKDGVTSMAANSVNLSAIEFARRVGRFITKDTLLGRAVGDILKAHFNVSSEERFDVRSLGIMAYNAEVSDVVSQSDTVNSNGDGEVLGAYAGRGIGHDNGTFRFEAPSFGFLFVYSFVLPDMEYNQGNDPTLGAVTRFDIPTPEFDGLGYEVTPMTTIYDGRGVSNISRAEFMHGSFGYIPRYSGFKVKKNVVYGDFALRGMRSQYDAYHTDRLLRFDDYYTIGENRVGIVDSKVPAASTSWRFVDDDKLGDYNRIFYAHGFLDPNVVDCMIQQTSFDVKLRNRLKPISQSFEVYNDGDQDMTINRE